MIASTPFGTTLSAFTRSKISPAKATGASQTFWSIDDLYEMMNAVVPTPGPRGPYKSAAPKIQTKTLRKRASKITITAKLL